MVRTQIQLPDELYKRAKRFSADREMSLAEAVRRALEEYLERFPECEDPCAEWEPPVVSTGGLLVPPDKLKDLIWDDEDERLLEKIRPK